VGLLLITVLIFTSCGRDNDAPESNGQNDLTNDGEIYIPGTPGNGGADATEIPDTSEITTEPTFVYGMTFTHSMELLYAEHFTVDYFEGGHKLLTIFDTPARIAFGEVQRFLIVPEGAAVPNDLPEDIGVLQQPLYDMLVASTPVASFVNRVGGLAHFSMTHTAIGSWHIPEIRQKMEDGDWVFIGTGAAPDFELIAQFAPPLAIWNAMPNPDVLEMLNQLNIPVLVDQSSMEVHPLGRSEWMKLYSALLNLEDEAFTAFNHQVYVVSELTVDEPVGKTVAIFFANTAGQLFVRNAGDYMVRMVELAGGTYIMPNLGPDETGNTVLEPEAFFVGAHDADFVIHVWSLGGRPADIAAMLDRSPILGEFRAVREGNVWGTADNFFQVSDTLGYMIRDINLMLTNDSPDLQLDFLHRLPQ